MELGRSRAFPCVVVQRFRFSETRAAICGSTDLYGIALRVRGDHPAWPIAMDSTVVSKKCVAMAAPGRGGGIASGGLFFVALPDRNRVETGTRVSLCVDLVCARDFKKK